MGLACEGRGPYGHLAFGLGETGGTVLPCPVQPCTWGLLTESRVGTCLGFGGCHCGLWVFPGREVLVDGVGEESVTLVQPSDTRQSGRGTFHRMPDLCSSDCQGHQRQRHVRNSHPGWQTGREVNGGKAKESNEVCTLVNNNVSVSAHSL